MPRSPDPARDRLIDAGARLFAERGIDSVSLREISRASGSRNVVALQHHFTDRDGMLAAILQRHLPEVDERRHQLLDAYEDAGKQSLEQLATALVEPLSACLRQDGGRDFLRIMADLLNRPRPIGALQTEGIRGDSLERWSRLTEPLLPHEQQRLHRRFAATLYITTELARRSPDHAAEDIDLTTSLLVDIVVGILSAPVRPVTKRLLRAHDQRRDKRRRS
jgi:AcrR family transcriptional regulator